MKEDQKPLYFVAVIPPEEHLEKYQRIRLHFKERFRTFSALRSPPHITLIPPFRLGEKRLAQMKLLMKSAIRSLSPFTIRVQGYGKFDRRVIYANPILSAELENLKKELDKITVETDPRRLQKNHRPFHPHITLAFRDLQEKYFDEAWASLVDFPLQDEFAVDSIHLLHLEKGRWMIKESFRLEG